MTSDSFTGKVLLDMAVSLDGYIAGPNDDPASLYDWYFQAPAGEADPNPGIVADLLRTTGAIVMGRRAYDHGDRQDGFVDNPYHVEHLVLTHAAPAMPAKGVTSFTFVTGGVADALLRAKAAAGDRHVVVAGGAHAARQFLSAGMLDEIHLHVVPVLLGAGLRLFDDSGLPPVELESLGAIAAPGVTHLRFRVRRPRRQEARTPTGENA